MKKDTINLHTYYFTSLKAYEAQVGWVLAQDDNASKLKNNKAHDVMCPIYVKLFNVKLKTGVIPDSWSIGIIVPIKKNKRSVDDPNNYRGIFHY